MRGCLQDLQRCKRFIQKAGPQTPLDAAIVSEAASSKPAPQAAAQHKAVASRSAAGATTPQAVGGARVSLKSQPGASLLASEEGDGADGEVQGSSTKRPRLSICQSTIGAKQLRLGRQQHDLLERSGVRGQQQVVNSDVARVQVRQQRPLTLPAATQKQANGVAAEPAAPRQGAKGGMLPAAIPPPGSHPAEQQPQSRPQQQQQQVQQEQGKPLGQQAQLKDSPWPHGKQPWGDVVKGHHGHSVLVLGGALRISSNFATPSHLLHYMFTQYIPALRKEYMQVSGSCHCHRILT
jgi:hypothetical protein